MSGSQRLYNYCLLEKHWLAWGNKGRQKNEEKLKAVWCHYAYTGSLWVRFPAKEFQG